jgi:hypothetical protein
MKGGKEGRKRRSSAGSTGRQGSARGKPRKGGAGSQRPENAAPRKGSPKNTRFGPRTSSGDEQ